MAHGGIERYDYTVFKSYLIIKFNNFNQNLYSNQMYILILSIYWIQIFSYGLNNKIKIFITDQKRNKTYVQSIQLAR